MSLFALFVLDVCSFSSILITVSLFLLIFYCSLVVFIGLLLRLLHLFCSQTFSVFLRKRKRRTAGDLLTFSARGGSGCFTPWEGGTQQSSIKGGSTPRYWPSPLYIPFLAEKVPLSHTKFYYYASLLTAVNALSFK